ncbi:MAG: hypothetical protein C0184_05430 [Chloroflexus aggregans]|uniref:Uncharacterized protein n=1 Tax=Chloroflexus aggregans TaxID=152260 RepID=A0A2J6X8A6_9CHLR|nr:MAG: hypothetical protein C0184_05430 [Chloroflexus aggregans]
MSDQNILDPKTTARTINLVEDQKSHLSHIAQLAVLRALQRCVQTVASDIATCIGQKSFEIVLVHHLIDEHDRLLIETVRQFVSRQPRSREPVTRQPDVPVLGTNSLAAMMSPVPAMLDSISNSIQALAAVAENTAKLVALLRSDYTLYPTNTTIDQATLYAALAHSLLAQQQRVYTFPPLEADTQQFPIEHTLREILLELLNKSTPDDSKENDAHILKQLFNLLITSQSVTTPPADTSTESLLFRVLLAERLLNSTQNGQPRFHQLAARVTQSGCDLIAKKNFFNSGFLIFVGGCTVEYTLATPNGNVIAANVVQSSEQVTFNLGSGKLTHRPLTPPSG